MAAKSWLTIPKTSHFSLANIPFGIITTPTSQVKHCAVAIGDHALDLAVFADADGFSALPSIHAHTSVFAQPTLNSFARLGRPVHREVRKYLQSVFGRDTPYPNILKLNHALQQRSLFPLKDVQTHLPMQIGDYTDFYAGLNHAYHVGVLFRGAANALQPNYTHLPVGYHGRASSVVVSGTSIRRPWGQVLHDPAAETKVPVFKPCQRLDIELEMAAFVCKDNELGEPISIDHAKDSIFGFVLMNDWSARDIQAWEYVPLGPFTSKNFGTTISPWVVLVDAMEPFLGQGLHNDTALQDYLKEENSKTCYDIALEVDITTKAGTITTITRTNALNLLWSFPQMLTHHSITGCSMRVGDLLGSGTISGTESGTEGSLLEQSQGGKVTMKLAGGEERKFLEDHDVVTIRGWSTGDEGVLVGFGECMGRIEPALEL